MVKWLSGRKRCPAKALDYLCSPVGSNPTFTSKLKVYGVISLAAKSLGCGPNRHEFESHVTPQNMVRWLSGLKQFFAKESGCDEQLRGFESHSHLQIKKWKSYPKDSG